jgi:hypothetical protein
MYNDNKTRKTYTETTSVPVNGEVSITIQPNGGIVLIK